MNATLIALYLAVALAICVSVLCIKQKYKDQKACFLVDLFSVTAAGMSLAISPTVLYQTTDITNLVQQVPTALSFETGSSAVVKARIDLTCLGSGDGPHLQCQVTGGNLQPK